MTAPERIAREVLVRGRVQGVAFRYYARERAASLGLAGWVRNLADGRVQAWLEGAPAEVESMTDWLRTGPPSARVEGIELAERAPEGEPGAGFEIRSSRIAP